MTNQKIVRTETAEVLLFDLNQELGEIKIGFGVSFCLHKEELFVSETPFLSLNLSPIEHIMMDNGTFRFDAQFSENNIHFIIKPTFPSAEDLMLFFQQLSKKPLPEAISFSDSIDLQVDNGELLLRLENSKTNNRILVAYSDVYGNHITQIDNTPATPEMNTTYKCPLAFQPDVQGMINPNKYRFQFLKS